MFSRQMVVLAAVTAMLFASSAQAGGQAAASTEGESLATGEKRPLIPNSPEKGDAIWIEPGRQLSGNFADAPSYYGKRAKIMVYRVQGEAGKAITAKADSPDVHIWLWFSRDLTSAWTGPTMSPMPVAGGPKTNFVTLIPQRSGPYYVMVRGVSTKENGKLDFGKYAQEGRFTLTMTNADNPEFTAEAAPASATPPSGASALAQNYAQLCSDPAQAGSGTCVALRQALAAQIAEAKKISDAKITNPLGLRVVEGSGGQVRAEIVAVDPSGVAAAAGLKTGDALLYAKAADGSRTFFGDQASVDAWAARQPADSTHEISYARKGNAAVLNAIVRLGAPAVR